MRGSFPYEMDNFGEVTWKYHHLNCFKFLIRSIYLAKRLLPEIFSLFNHCDIPSIFSEGN